MLAIITRAVAVEGQRMPWASPVRSLRLVSRHMRDLVDSTRHEIHIKGRVDLHTRRPKPVSAPMYRALVSLLQRLHGVLQRVHLSGLCIR